MSDCECIAVDGPAPSLVGSGVKKDLDNHAKKADVQCAEEILMQMVRTRTEDGQPRRTGGALPDIGEEVHAIESGGAGKHRGVSGKANAKANAGAKVKGPGRGRASVHTIDSSPEPDPDARHKKDRGRHRSESGSSSSHSRRRRRGRSSSSSGSSPRRKKRINNFSSIRNVEKERAKTRGYRTAGAAAAIKVVQTEVQGPYFAP
uniref:Uncharacterized protein n=1 Tax=Alexandrium monilatum TaxID=311494 RepID=A0A7S4Q117_9DINO|mmetsp:Transcript_90756/g.270904  ORF Transcript_90756/g.270904 Transcript_90756/m.270904 type:complete len:204 (-) Transcript_90756:102-713(-)